MRRLTVVTCGIWAWACEPPASEFMEPPPGEMMTVPNFDDFVTEKWAAWADGRLDVYLDYNGGLGTVYIAVNNVRRQAYSGSLIASPGRSLQLQTRIELAERPAEVQIRSESDELLGVIAVDDQQVRSPGEACQRFLGIDRCEVGSICVPDDSDCQQIGPGAPCIRRAGHCTSAEVAGRQFDDGLRLRVRAVGMGVEPFKIDGQSVSGTPSADGYVDLRVPDYRAQAVELHHGFDRVAAAIPIEPVTVSMNGEVCDPTGFSSVCVDELLCHEATCEAPAAPIIESAEFILTEEAFGVRVVGTDVNQDIHSIRGTVRGVEGFNFNDSTLLGTSEFSFRNRTTRVLYDGDRFTYQYSRIFDPDDARARQVTDGGFVRIEDREALASESFEFEVRDPADVPEVPIGALCDVPAVWARCPQGARCYREDTMLEARCAVVDGRCPDGLAIPLTEAEPVVQDDTIRFSDLANTRSGYIGCGQPSIRGTMLMYQFVAPEAGTYQFTLWWPGMNSTGYIPKFSMSVRASCLHLHSDLACVFSDGSDDVVADVELTAGQAVAIAVQGVVAFDLSVTQL